MADLYELIERMQVTLASSSSPAKDQLRELHGELSDQIRRTNKRLRECDALLAKGLRTEAIQLAEQEPALLDVVAILDFPELPEWNDFVAELGLTVAPDLQIEIAADLNRAYSDDGPLKAQMKKFRISSLTRAPLKTRIALLRKIAEVDSGNQIWETDLRSYEEVRHRQIQDRFQIASKNQNYNELRSIAKELHGKWLLPPQKKFIQRVDQEIRSLQQGAAQNRLAELTQELQDAFVERDVSWAVEVQAEWEKAVKNCGESDSVRRLQNQAHTVFRWVTEQQKREQNESKFNEAVERLQRAIHGGSDISELNRRFNVASRIAGFELPESVHDAYKAAVLNDQRKKTLRMIVIASLAGVVIVAAAIVFLVLKLMK